MRSSRSSKTKLDASFPVRYPAEEYSFFLFQDKGSQKGRGIAPMTVDRAEAVTSTRHEVTTDEILSSSLTLSSLDMCGSFEKTTVRRFHEIMERKESKCECECE